MQKIWNIRTNNKSIQENLSRKLDISPVLAQLLMNRGLAEPEAAHDFLYADLSACYDPFLLKGMDKTVSRIKKAAENKESVLIYGDYDVDGITSVALLDIIFRELGINAHTYIPNRLEEGYGLNEKAVKFAKDKGITLIITADCGIGAIDEVNLANSFGIDVIITDHHEIKQEELPKAFSIINPHQKDCRYPFKHLAGVGLAYKLSEALMKKRYYPLEKHLDLVALGTVADIAPQKSENRIFTKHGIAQLNETEKEGLKALIDISGLGKRDISSRHIGYILGPRINAMGRLGSPDIALRLLLTDSKVEAARLANILNEENRNRQKIESEILDSAMSKVEKEVNFKEHRLIVLDEEGWHPGVIGIVASRIQEKYYRPTILIAVKGNIGKGSGRSIERFHLFNALIDARGYLLDFGGHESACGLSIHKRNISKFRERINIYARGAISGKDLFPRIDIDIHLPLSNLNFLLLNELEMLKPYGPGNPRPIFLSSGITLRHEPKFIGRNGFKFWITHGDTTCEAVTFRRELMDTPRLGEVLDIAYSPATNSWQGIDSIQLDLRDIRVNIKQP